MTESKNNINHNFEVEVESKFSAAHRLRNYGTKCENIHGHNWKVIAVVKSEKLNELGVCIDFKFLKKALEKVLEELDHRNLNTIAFFRKVNPSAENIARFVFEKLESKINDRRVKLIKVKVSESEGCTAIYSTIKCKN